MLCALIMMATALAGCLDDGGDDKVDWKPPVQASAVVAGTENSMFKLNVTLFDANSAHTKWDVELRIIAKDRENFEMLNKTWDIKAEDFKSVKVLWRGEMLKIPLYELEIPYSEFTKTKNRHNIGEILPKVGFSNWITYDGNTYKSGTAGGDHIIPISLFLPNENPVADLVGPTEGFVDQDLEFSASGSTDDRDFDLLDFEWDWGDGSTGGFIDYAVVSNSYDKAGTYTVTVTVEDSERATDTASITVTIVDPPRDFLWSIGPLSDSEVSKVLVDDVDDDGSLEMVAGSGSEIGDDGKVHGRISIYDLATHELEWSSSDIGAVSDFELVNIDGDPALEIVAGVMTQWTDAGAISGFGYVFDGSSHSEEWKSGNIGGVGEVEIGNADDDPDLELVFSYTSEYIFNMATFTVNLKGGIGVYGSDFSEEWASTGYGGTFAYFVGDLDGDSTNEILISTTSSMGFAGTVGDLSVISWTGSAYDRVHTLDDVFPNAVEVADIDGDGELEIIVGESGGDFGGEGNVTVYDKTLSILWTTGDIGEVHSLAVDDVDGDGALDVLVGVVTEEDSWEGTFIGNLYIFDGQGNEVWKSGSTGKINSIVTGDLLGDNGKEIAVVVVEKETEDQGATCAISVFDGSSHQEVSKETSLGDTLPFDLVCVDGDGDGKDDLLFGSTEDDEGYITLYKIN